MKKDKKWAIKEVDRYLSYEGVNEDRNALLFAKGVIDQLDEPEVEQLNNKIRELESYNDELIRDNNQLRNAIDNQETLSQNWIDEHTKRKFFDFDEERTEVVLVDDLQNLLVPKQEDMFNGEKPDEGEVYFAIGLEGAVEINSARSIDEAIERLTEHDTSYNILKKTAIPKFVAETIEEDKERGYDVYDSIDLIIETNGGGLPSISDWVARNIDKYARAYLTGRYEVEEEQKYYVLNEDKQLMLKKHEGEVESAYNSLRGVGENYLTFYQLTEQEIKDYDERYMAFAVKVEELEE